MLGSVLAVEYYHAVAELEPFGLVTTCAASITSVNATADPCRVVLNVNSTASSNALVEGWRHNNRNYRMMSTGGGGISGCVDYSTIMYDASSVSRPLARTAAITGQVDTISP